MTTPSTVTISFTGNTPLSAADALILSGISDAITGAPAVAALIASAGTAVAPSPVVAAVSVSDQPASDPATPASAVDPVTAKYFPADPGLAAFPSPENSRILRESDTISGRPFLIDKTGAVHQLIAPTTAVPNGYTVNGAHAGGGGSDESFGELLVRQGSVFAERSSGQWQLFNPGMGGMYNASLPDAFATDASGATTSTTPTSSVKAPTLPARMSPAPGTSGKTLTVGVGKAFAAISDAIKAAAAGDTIAIDAATYKEAPPTITVPVHLIGIGGQFVIDCTGLTASLARQKGALVPVADCIFEGGRVTGVATDQTDAELTSCVRPDVGCGYLLLKNMELDGSQCGLGSGADCTIEITVDGGHFHNDGEAAPASGSGFTHNIYTGAGTSLILQNGFVSDAPVGGHAVKSRGFAFSAMNCTLKGGGDASIVDLPDGTVAPATIDSCTLTDPAGSANHCVLGYASESANSGLGGLLVTNTVIDSECDNPFIQAGNGSVITLGAGVTFKGTKPTADGTVKGL